jgi:hypothetical protein
MLFSAVPPTLAPKFASSPAPAPAASGLKWSLAAVCPALLLSGLQLVVIPPLAAAGFALTFALILILLALFSRALATAGGVEEAAFCLANRSALVLEIRCTGAAAVAAAVAVAAAEGVAALRLGAAPGPGPGPGPDGRSSAYGSMNSFRLRFRIACCCRGRGRGAAVAEEEPGAVCNRLYCWSYVPLTSDICPIKRSLPPPPPPHPLLTLALPLTPLESWDFLDTATEKAEEDAGLYPREDCPLLLVWLLLSLLPPELTLPPLLPVPKLPTGLRGRMAVPGRGIL